MDVLLLNADAQPLTVLPLSTNSWQDAIKAVWQEDVAIVEEYDNWIVRSPSVQFKVPSVIMLHNYIHVSKSVAFSKHNVFLRDDFTCQYCGKKDCRLTYDHVIPRKHGGKTTWTNIVAACLDCNNRKGSDLKFDKPRIAPVKPDYWKLAAKQKQADIIVPHDSWVQFLDWSGNVSVNKRPDTLTELNIISSLKAD